MAKWMEAVKNLYKPRECPVCGYGITVKQRWQMPITRLRAWKCPGCQTELYLKGFLPLLLYMSMWCVLMLLSPIFLFHTYASRNFSQLIYSVLACAGAYFLLLPFLPIAWRKKEK